MADILPENFPVPSENVVASYSFTDLEEGTGVTEYALCVSEAQAGKDEFLTSKTLISRETTRQVSVNSANNNSDVLDVDFDLSTFNLPRTVFGTVIVNGAMGHRTLFTTSANVTYYIEAKLRKWDGSAETEIASGKSQSEVFGNSGSVGTVTSSVFLITFSVSTPVSFAIGETLRLTMIAHVDTAGANGASIGFGVDPAARTDSSLIQSDDSTRTEVLISYRIEE